MSAFTIQFLNFGVFVHHRNGVTLVFGADGHELRYMTTGRPSTLIPPGTNIELRVTDRGTPVHGGPTLSHAGSYLVDLDWMMGRPVAIDRERVLGANTTAQNGRVHLHGGNLFDHPGGSLDEPHPLRDALWDFSAFGARTPSLHRLTNRASFVHTMMPGRTYELHVGGQVIELGPDMQVIIENEDTLENESECEDLSRGLPGAIDQELRRLLPAVGIDPGASSSSLHTIPPFIPPAGKICQPCEFCESRQDF
jgi:hypothetical protein